MGVSVAEYFGQRTDVDYTIIQPVEGECLYMIHVILDFSDIQTVLELHQYLKEVLDLPAYYRNNMDALWRCLSCCYDESTTIELKNLDVLRKRLEKTTKTMLEVFQDLHDEDGVIIQIAERETTHSEKCFTIDNDDLSGYWV